MNFVKINTDLEQCVFYTLEDLKCRFYSTKKIFKVYPLQNYVNYEFIIFTFMFRHLIYKIIYILKIGILNLQWCKCRFLNFRFSIFIKIFVISINKVIFIMLP
jgi:hypothetical protein